MVTRKILIYSTTGATFIAICFFILCCFVSTLEAPSDTALSLVFSSCKGNLLVALIVWFISFITISIFIYLRSLCKSEGRDESEKC